MGIIVSVALVRSMNYRQTTFGHPGQHGRVVNRKLAKLPKDVPAFRRVGVKNFKALTQLLIEVINPRCRTLINYSIPKFRHSTTRSLK